MVACSQFALAGTDHNPTATFRQAPTSLPLRRTSPLHLGGSVSQQRWPALQHGKAICRHPFIIDKLQVAARQLVGDACGPGQIHTDSTRCHLRDDRGSLSAGHKNTSNAPPIPLPRHHRHEDGGRTSACTVLPAANATDCGRLNGAL
jgi:hypothetical protein